MVNTVCGGLPMDSVALDPGAYDGTYKLIGGETCLDLVNTVSWRGTEREHDWLDRPENVTAWAAAAGVIGPKVRAALDARPRAALDADLREVHRTRATLAAVLGPLARGERPAPEAVDGLNRLLGRAASQRRVDARTLAWAWETPASLS